MQREVTVWGSANADLRVMVEEAPQRGRSTVAHDFEMGPGGIGLNQAVAAARMGARTTFIGAIGTDDYGAMLLGCLAESGVEACLEEIDGRVSGAALIALDADGEITVIELPGANAALDEPTDRARAVLADSPLLLVQLETPVVGTLAAVRTARSAGATVILDAAPHAMGAEALLPYVDVLVADRAQAQAILAVHDAAIGARSHEAVPSATPPTLPASKDLAERLAALVPVAIIFEPGADVVIGDADGVRVLAAYVTHALDRSAATDTFCGALAARLSAGATVDSSAQRAMAAATLALQRPGSAVSIPTSTDVDEFLALLEAG